MKRTGPANSFEERLVSLIYSHLGDIEILKKQLKSAEQEINEYQREMDSMDHGDRRRCTRCAHFTEENIACYGCAWNIPCEKWCQKERGVQVASCSGCKKRKLCEHCTICIDCENKLP